MPSIPGRLEWDDESLTPGQRQGGGLHSTLFRDGHLEGSSRFIPDDPDRGSAAAPQGTSTAAALDSEEDTSLSSEERERLEALVTGAVLAVLAVAIYAPHARRLWRDRVQPALQVRREDLARRLRQLRRLSRRDATVLDGVVVDAVHAAAAEEPTVDMTAAEADAHRVLALALRQASDDQLRLLARAIIVDDVAGAAGARQLQLVTPRALDAGPLLTRLSSEPATLTGDEALTAVHLLLATDREHETSSRENAG